MLIKSQYRYLSKKVPLGLASWWKIRLQQVKHVQDIIIRMGNVCFLKGHQQSFIMGY